MNRDFLKKILVVGIMALGLYFLSTKIGEEEIREIVGKAGVFGPLLYICLLAFTFVIAPLSGSPVFFAGFLVFGKVFIVYSYLASLLGMAINFWLARILGRKIVVKLVGQNNMNKVDEFTNDYGIMSLIFLRIFQGYINDFISYAYGLTNMRFFPYFLVSSLASLPMTFFWWFVLLPRISDFGDFFFWLVITLIPFYAVSAFLVWKYKKQKSVLVQK